MQQAIEMAESLNAQIRNSDEYKRYQETSRRLKQQPELYERFNEFRRRNYELQFSEGDADLYDEVVHLMKEYEPVLQESTVNEFRLAEQRLSVLMRNVYTVLSEDLELDYEYLEK
jgi:cell fate (sporulation/competence/biofilm development) regulator YlbF (YheA/YmcA/DUF963 family)